MDTATGGVSSSSPGFGHGLDGSPGRRARYRSRRHSYHRWKARIPSVEDPPWTWEAVDSASHDGPGTQTLRRVSLRAAGQGLRGPFAPPGAFHVNDGSTRSTSVQVTYSGR